MHTIFLDIDGCLLLQEIPVTVQAKSWAEPIIIPGTIEKLVEWADKDYKIILTTGRKECYRRFTEWQLRRAGIFYDRLIMDVGCGPRVVINDMKNEEVKAYAFNVKRNEGIRNVVI